MFAKVTQIRGITYFADRPLSIAGINLLIVGLRIDCGRPTHESAVAERKAVISYREYRRRYFRRYFHEAVWMLIIVWLLLTGTFFVIRPTQPSFSLQDLLFFVVAALIMLEHFPRNRSRVGFRIQTSCDSIHQQWLGDSDGQTLQHGLA